MAKSKSNDYIRSTPIQLKYVNQAKKNLIKFAMDEYRIAMQNAIDYYWLRHNLDGNYTYNELRSFGKFYPYDKEINHDSALSGRMLKAAHTQAMGMINSAIKSQMNRMYRWSELQKNINSSNIKQISNLQRKIHKTKLVKPTVPKSVNMTLDTNTCKIYDHTATTFNICIELSAVFNPEFKAKTFKGKNKIPLLVKTHRRYYHWLNHNGTKRLNSVLINDKTATIRFKTPKKIKDTGIKVAIDQGIKTCITAVDDNGEIFESGCNNHGYDLDQICKIMVGKTKGTKSYKKSIEHRKNYVNWAINQLNLDPYNQLVLEEIKNIGYKQHSTEYLKKIPTQLIKGKIQSRCEEKDVLFSLQSSPYRSQRCNGCGYVHSRNRNKKFFLCIKCGYSEDSDINAAKNHLLVLPDLDRQLIYGINKTTGFYWNSLFDGVYTPIPVIK